MTFQLVYYSQQDPKWRSDVLGFGDTSDTIGYVGCALTSTAMLVSGYGFTQTPKTLNEKLKSVGGFASAGIRWGSVSQLHPQITLKSTISCVNVDAPLGLIDASLAAGEPVIVMVDSTPAAGLLTHWVVLYAKDGNDYLMLDPWPHQTDVTKKTYLMPRYSQGNPLKRAIMHVIIYESAGVGGGITQPGSSSTSGPTPSSPTSGPAPSGGPYARVKADVTWGLNIRSTIDTSSTINIVASVPAGALLTLLEPNGPAKVGAVNQWLRVRDDAGHEGYAAAWYLEKGPGSAPAPAPAPIPAPVGEEPPPAPTTPAEPKKLIVVVKSAGGKVFANASAKSAVLSKEKAGATLVVVEAVDAAIPKIGMAGQWLTVKGSNGKRGYIDGGAVKEG